MKKKSKIEELNGILGLPVTFNLLTKVELNKQKEKHLFVSISIYNGVALAEAFTKPCSKIINWKLIHE